MEDFTDKKENFANAIENYINDSTKQEQLIELIKTYQKDIDFKSKELFTNLFSELLNYLPELSKKDLKQRLSIIKTFIE